MVKAAETIYNNATGNQGGYDYELWKDYGTTSMTLNNGGTFSCEWSNIGNALFRKGIKFDSTKTYQQLGNISVDYGCNYQPNGNSYLCVYGWTKSPLVEYYIVESWGTWRPPGATSKGTITVDGGTYDVYETTRVNQPSIEGDTTFQQYWSVRTSKRTSGTISVSDHFKAWENKGMRMGKMYETALTVEGYQSSGSANVYQNDIKVGGSGGGGGDVTPTTVPTVRSAFETIEAEAYNSKNSSSLQEIGTTNGGKGIGYIENGNSVTYSQIDFGSGASKVSAVVATENDTTIQIRQGSASGTLLGTLNVGSTGGWDNYREVSANISNVSGIKDIVLVFSGAVNVDSFKFTGTQGGGGGQTPTPENPGTTRSAFTTIQAEDYDSNNSTSMQMIDTQNGGRGIGYIENGNTVTFKNVDFGTGASKVTMLVASEQSPSIQMRLGSSSGTLIGTVSVNSTGGWNNYQNKTANVQNVSGVKDLVLVFSGPVNVDSFVFTAAQGTNPTPTAEPTPTQTPSANTTSATSTIQAENYNSTNAASNIQVFDTGNGGKGVGYIENGNTLTYNNIDFGTGASSFKAYVATEGNTSIQIRKDSANGTLLGTLNVTSTGSWNTYQEKTTTISNVTGVQAIVLVFQGAVNVDWFTFAQSQSGGGGGTTPTPDYSGKKLVALTFDDGPNTNTTPQILDKLERYGVVATFFLIGQNINDGVKPVMQRQVSMGCEIANHSYSHNYMNNMDAYSAGNEVARTNSLIQQMTGTTPKFFRPPYISTSNAMYQGIDLPFICGIMCDDWQDNVSAQSRANTIISNVKDGDIILMHDFSGNSNTVAALDTIIPWLKNNGYELVTVSQLFELKGVNPNQEYKIWTNVLN